MGALTSIGYTAFQTNPNMQPYWYQDESVQSLLDYYIRGNTGNPIVAIPTGGGKSLIQSEFMRRVLSFWPRQRFMCLTHVKELIAQNVADCLEYWPAAPVGVYSAGLDQRIAHTPIVFGGIATVVNCIELFGWRDVLIIDECHLLSSKDESMYGKVIAGLKKINPYLKVIGLTATPYRTGQGLLTEGGLFTDIVYDMTSMEMFNLLVKQGFIADFRSKPTGVEIDVSNLKMNSDGEYNKDELQGVSDIDAITDAAVREVCYWGTQLNRQSWLTFATGITHAENINKKYNRYGVRSTWVHGKMDKKERDDNIEGFKAGYYRSMVNYNILSTGFNHKPIDMIVHLRATGSTGWWIQANGRGGRAYRGKDYCFALDFAGNTRRLGPINDPLIPQKRGKKTVAGVAPVKICPRCNFYNHTRAPQCINCAYEFPPSIKIEAEAAFDQLLRTTKEPIVETFNVQYVVYKEHKYPHSRPFLQVQYHCGAMGVQRFDDKIWLENDGASKGVARDWWRKRYVGDGTCRRPQSFAGYIPDSIAEALELRGQLKTPRTIRVRLDKSEPEVVGYDI